MIEMTLILLPFSLFLEYFLNLLSKFRRFDHFNIYPVFRHDKISIVLFHSIEDHCEQRQDGVLHLPFLDQSPTYLHYFIVSFQNSLLVLVFFDFQAIFELAILLIDLNELAYESIVLYLANEIGKFVNIMADDRLEGFSEI